MSDIKLFTTQSGQVQELTGTTDTIEKSMQVFFEKNLEALLGVRFLSTEFITSSGRIDTLGVDENGYPVILEYKRASNENVVTQGLFYLDWLMDHRKDFAWLVMEKFGKSAVDKINWSAPRLSCIAGDFSRYDEHAVRQIDRNIGLIRYRRFGKDLIMLDLVTATSGEAGTKAARSEGPQPKTSDWGAIITGLDNDLQDRFEALRSYLMALGSDVQETGVQEYIAFKRIKNFACVEFRPRDGRILVFVKVKPSTVTLEAGFTRDVSNVGHFGTGDLEITLSKPEDLERASRFIKQSYENS